MKSSPHRPRLSWASEDLAGYEERLAALHEEKRGLYERMVLGEMGAAAFRQGRDEVDAAILQSQASRDALKTRLARMDAALDATGAAHFAATKASEAGKLTRPLAEMLIEKVFVYPGKRVEILWKHAGFAGGMRKNEEGVDDAG